MKTPHHLKQSHPIEEVAARYATLHRQGNNYKMLCPFHDDHHPSMTIHVGRQFFKCHACGEGGDVFKLVQQFEHCSFGEAIERLTGTRHDPPAPPDRSRQPTNKEILVSATIARDNETFLQMLLPYAAGEKQLSSAYLDFEVGMAPHLLPDRWRKFAGRLIFPIRNEEGMLTGFAGRSHTTGPKYLNSSAGEGFHKDRMLYGIHRAAEIITRTGVVYLVEGYKDALAMHAAGLINTVAIGGTAFTAGQREILARNGVKQVRVVLDGDHAGQNAACRIAAHCREERWEVVNSRLPSGEDPDSLYCRLGSEQFCLYMSWTVLAGKQAEKRLADYCLLYPGEATGILRHLHADDMPLTDPLVGEMVENVSRGEPVPEVIASQLDSTAIDPSLIDSYRKAYYEERLTGDVCRLRREIAQTATGNNRSSTYTTLRHKLTLLASLRAELGRMVATLKVVSG